MYMQGPSQDELGFSLNPFRAVRAVASGVASVAKTAAGAAIKYNPAMLTYKASLWAAEKTIQPVRSRLNTITDRRAGLLAMQRRRSKVATSGERAEAREWTKNMLRAKGPHGRLVALLAGPALGALGMSNQLGVAPVLVVAAAVPPIVALLNQVIAMVNKSGEAPADPADALRRAQEAIEATKRLQEQAAAIAPSEPSADQTAGYFGEPADVSGLAAGVGLGLGLLTAGAGIFVATRR